MIFSIQKYVRLSVLTAMVFLLVGIGSVSAQTAMPSAPATPTVPVAPVAAAPVAAQAQGQSPAYTAPIPALHSAPIRPLLNTTPEARAAMTAVVQNLPIAPKVEVKADRNFIALYLACAGYTNRSDRLVCYDNIALQMGLMTPEQQTKQDQLISSFGLWEVVQSQDEMNRPRFYLKLDSNAAVLSHTGLSLRPTLTLSCQAGNTDLYINWKYSLINDVRISAYPVTFAFDNDHPALDNWKLTDDHYAVSPPDIAKFIRAMRVHSKLNIVISPEGESTASIIYDLTGFQNALALLVKHCYSGQPAGAQGTQAAPQ